MGRLAVLAVCLAGVIVAAQAPEQPPRQPTFRTSLELVRVDATVIDSDGNPVTTLTKEDFALEEDGVAQRIEQFKLLELNGHPAPGDDTSLAVTSRGHAATEVAREDVRVFLVFWDDYHIALHPSASLLRDALKKFLRTGLGPTDMVAVMTQWTPASAIEFTRDHHGLAVDVDKLEGRRGNYMPRNAAEENHVRASRGIPIVRAQVSASALRAAIAHLGAIREGRKTILYFSEEYGLGRDTHSEGMSLIQAANDANVAVYSVNPDGLAIGRGRFGIITDLARNSGGESLQTNALDLAIRRAVAQASATYLLGYSPAPLRHDGKFHRIGVRVKPRGLQVRARNGYWAPHPGAVRRALDEAAKAPPTSSPVMKAFGELSRLATSEREEGAPALRTILSPEAKSDSLAVEMPLVWRVRRAADLQAVLSTTPPVPVLEREFVRGDRLIIRVDVSGTRSSAAALTARLLGRGGVRLIDVPAARPSADAAQWRIDLPLNSIARGDYVIGIEATSGETRAAAYVPIRITGG